MRRLRFHKQLTGVSTPFGGVSWETVPDLEKEVLSRLMPFLEDRRVLYNPTEVEIPEHCLDSVMQIRRFLVAEAGRLPAGSELAGTLRHMAGACRGFLDRLPGPLDRHRLGHPATWGFDGWVFNQALGEWRGQIGVYLQVLHEQYNVALPSSLAGILPPPPDDGM